MANNSNQNNNVLLNVSSTLFSFLSFKAKMIVLGVVILVVLIILIPIIALSSVSKKVDEKNGNIASGSSSIQISQDTKKYENASFPMPFETWDSSKDVITSPYGTRIDPITSKVSFHSGIDLVVRSISNPKICSVANGVVTLRTFNGRSSYGNGIEIMHTLEDGTVFFTFYAHMKDNSVVVSVGDTVEVGQVIGEMGSTGASTGNHLHFEVRTKSGYGNHIDPYNFLFGKKEE